MEEEKRVTIGIIKPFRVIEIEGKVYKQVRETIIDKDKRVYQKIIPIKQR